MTGKMKELKSGEVVKFDKVGDSISGVLISVEPSSNPKFKNSYAVKLKNPAKEQPQVIFVNNIVVDLFKTNSIQPGAEVMIEYQGKKKSEKSGMEYNDYKVYA